jgi:hypothetical protein
MKSIIFCLKSFTVKRKVGIKELEFQFKHQSHHTYNSKLTRVPKQIQTIDENYARASAPLPNLHASVKKKICTHQMSSKKRWGRSSSHPVKYEETSNKASLIVFDFGSFSHGCAYVNKY